MKIIIIFFFFLSTLCSFINPVINEDIPDPCVTFFNNSYYAISTKESLTGIYQIQKSNDLINWKVKGYVLKQTEIPEWSLGDVKILILFIFFYLVRVCPNCQCRQCFQCLFLC